MDTKAIHWDEINVKPAQNMSDLLFTKISSMILSGKLPEGYAFPNEGVLCEQLHVGRSTIREAYKALELYGYVTRSKRGTFVNSKMDILNATPLKMAFSSVSEKDFDEFRLMLEVESAGLAAKNASEEQIQVLEAISGRCQVLYSASYMDKLMEADAEFHRSLAKASGNQLIVVIMTVMTSAWDEGIRRNFFYAMKNHPENFQRMHGEHLAVIEAIRSHDAEKAHQAIRKHIIDMTARME